MREWNTLICVLGVVSLVTGYPPRCEDIISEETGVTSSEEIDAFSRGFCDATFVGQRFQGTQRPSNTSCMNIIRQYYRHLLRDVAAESPQPYIEKCNQYQLDEILCARLIVYLRTYCFTMDRAANKVLSTDVTTIPDAANISSSPTFYAYSDWDELYSIPDFHLASSAKWLENSDYQFVISNFSKFKELFVSRERNFCRADQVAAIGTFFAMTLSKKEDSWVDTRDLAFKRLCLGNLRRFTWSSESTKEFYDWKPISFRQYTFKEKYEVLLSTLGDDSHSWLTSMAQKLEFLRKDDNLIHVHPIKLNEMILMNDSGLTLMGYKLFVEIISSVPVLRGAECIPKIITFFTDTRQGRNFRHWGHYVHRHNISIFNHLKQLIRLAQRVTDINCDTFIAAVRDIETSYYATYRREDITEILNLAIENEHWDLRTTSYCIKNAIYNIERRVTAAIREVQPDGYVTAQTPLGDISDLVKRRTPAFRREFFTNTEACFSTYDEEHSENIVRAFLNTLEVNTNAENALN